MGHTLQLARRKYMAKGCFDDQKKKLERDKRFFPEVLSQMINNDVDAWEVKFFIRIPTKYVIKYTDKLLSLRKIYCEIVIA